MRGTVGAEEAVDFVSAVFFAATCIGVVVDDVVDDVDTTAFAVDGGAGEDVVLSAGVLVVTASN